jgi:hypothetical protein
MLSYTPDWADPTPWPEPGEEMPPGIRGNLNPALRFVVHSRTPGANGGDWGRGG